MENTQRGKNEIIWFGIKVSKKLALKISFWASLILLVCSFFIMTGKIEIILRADTVGDVRESLSLIDWKIWIKDITDSGIIDEYHFSRSMETISVTQVMIWIAIVINAVTLLFSSILLLENKGFIGTNFSKNEKAIGRIVLIATFALLFTCIGFFMKQYAHSSIVSDFQSIDLN